MPVNLSNICNLVDTLTPLQLELMADRMTANAASLRKYACQSIGAERKDLLNSAARCERIALKCLKRAMQLAEAETEKIA